MSFQKHYHTIAIFLDISQAFDRTWHQALNYEINEIGTPHYLTQVITSFLSNRTFAVTVDYHHSNSKAVKAGLPQGSPYHQLFITCT